jgi:drug/metabolite transporter (DMT)-like permease
MALAFGVLAAVLLGCSDVCAAQASRIVASVSVTRTALVASSLIAVVLLAVEPVTWTVRDTAISSASGLAMTSGLLLLYRGYATAPVGIVGPSSSVVLALVPVLFDLAAGRSPSALGATGMLLGLAAIGLTSYVPGGNGSAAAGLRLGIVAGVCFGVGFTLMDVVSDDAGLSPVLVQRFAGLAMLVAAQRFDRQPLLVTRPPARRAAIATGLFAGAAMGALQAGFRAGDAGPVSVAASQYATVAVLLSVALLGERLRWWQAAGVAASAVGVGLLAMGG